MSTCIFPSSFPVTCHTDHVGPGSTFVAIQGMKQDGTLYIPKAIELGATKIIVDEHAVLDPLVLELMKEHGVEYERVTNTRKALAELSAQAHGYPANGLRIIGITGTKGKTTTAFLIEHLLKSAGYKTALISTVKNTILGNSFPAYLTTPQPDYLHTFFAVCKEQGVQFVVMEVAAQALSLHRVDSVLFDTIVFTNFSLEHSEFYATQDEYFAAKCALFKQCSNQGMMIVNADDDRVADAVRDMKNVQYFSMHKKADYTGVIQENDLLTLTMHVYAAHMTFTIKSTALLGEFSAYNVLAAIAVAQLYACSQKSIELAMPSFEGVPGRLERFTLPNHAVAFIDNAHTPSSFQALLSSLRPLSPHLIVVFGAGGERDSLKRPVMGSLAAQYADRVIITTDNPRSEDPHAIMRDILIGIEERDREKVIEEPDREKAIRCAYALSRPGTIIALLGKGPVEYQHIGDTKIPFSERSILRSL